MSSPHIAFILFSSLSVVACSSTPTDRDGPGGGAASIAIEPPALAFDALGLSSELIAVVRNAAGEVVSTPVAWRAENPGVATVSPSGVVTAVGNGTGVVRATAGGRSADVTVEVDQVATGLTLSPTPATLSVLGTQVQLAASVTDRNDRPISGVPLTWTSSDPQVIAVAPDGVATAVRPGAVTLTVTAGSVSAQASLEVVLDGPVGGPLLGTETLCLGGMAGPFPCSDVKLMSYLPVSGVGAEPGVELSDIWGWVDPATNKEYAIVMRSDGTAFVDVTDPVNPAYLGFLPIPASAHPNTWHDVKVYQNHAFIVADAAGPHGMQVFDLTSLRDVAVPRIFAELTRYTNIASAHNIFINEATGFAYSVGGSSGGTTCGGGLHMIDIRNPATPAFAGCFADPLTGRSGTGYTHDVQCVVYSGPDAAYSGHEICFGSNETALSIADVTSKSAPTAISRASYPAVAYTHQGWLTVDQRYFLVNDELDEGNGSVTATRTLIWDVSDLDDPVLVNQYLGPTTATDHNHYIRGSTMFMSNYHFGLRVVDVSAPLALEQIGFLDTAPNLANTPGFRGSWSNYPFFPSGGIVVTSRDEGFFVLRMMN